MARPKKAVSEVNAVTELPKEESVTISNETIVEKNGVKVIQWTDANGVTFVKPL